MTNRELQDAIEHDQGDLRRRGQTFPPGGFMKVTTKRKGDMHLVLLDGALVGTITHGEGAGFALSLKGVNWEDGEPTKNPAARRYRTFRRVKDCVEATAKWFDANPPVGTVLYTRAEVNEAWACVRRFNNSIPSECLDQMRAVLLQEVA